MKILTASRGHLPRMRAHKMRLPGTEHHFIFDNDAQRTATMNALGIPSDRCHVAHTPKDAGQCGVSFAREWGERNLTDEGEWYITIDDNVSHFTGLMKPEYNNERMDFEGHDSNYWRTMYDTKCRPARVMRIMHDTIDECERVGTVFGGFAIETNYYFRRLKWQRLGYVRTQASVVCNTGLPWVYWPGNMLEDFTRSVDVVARYGSIVINRFMKPHKPFFEEGGIGTFDERMPNLVRVSDELLERYPGLLRRNKGQDYQLTFALRSLNTVAKWRRENGYPDAVAPL